MDLFLFNMISLSLNIISGHKVCIHLKVYNFDSSYSTRSEGQRLALETAVVPRMSVVLLEGLCRSFGDARRSAACIV